MRKKLFNLTTESHDDVSNCDYKILDELHDQNCEVLDSLERDADLISDKVIVIEQATEELKYLNKLQSIATEDMSLTSIKLANITVGSIGSKLGMSYTNISVEAVDIKQTAKDTGAAIKKYVMIAIEAIKKTVKWVIAKIKQWKEQLETHTTKLTEECNLLTKLVDTRLNKDRDTAKDSDLISTGNVRELAKLFSCHGVANRDSIKANFQNAKRLMLIGQLQYITAGKEYKEALDKDKGNLAHGGQSALVDVEIAYDRHKKALATQFDNELLPIGPDVKHGFVGSQVNLSVRGDKLEFKEDKITVKADSIHLLGKDKLHDILKDNILLVNQLKGYKTTIEKASETVKAIEASSTSFLEACVKAGDITASDQEIVKTLTQFYTMDLISKAAVEFSVNAGRVANRTNQYVKVCLREFDKRRRTSRV